MGADLYESYCGSILAATVLKPIAISNDAFSIATIVFR